MNTIFHEGEYYIQELMSLRKSSDALASIIKTTMPKVAAEFLKELRFCVIALNTKADNLFTTTIYCDTTFIEINSDTQITINLDKRSYLPKSFFEADTLNLGMIGLDFERAMRIRINGKAKIQNNKLFISINEIYSNCPKYIKKRVFGKKLKALENQTISKENIITKDGIDVICNADTFFIATSHLNKGVDVSHRGGQKGFVKILSSKKLQFDDMPGNNLFNTLGNIYTNPYVNILFIDFNRNNTYHIQGKAKIKEIIQDKRKTLRVVIDCFIMHKNLNSFALEYKMKDTDVLINIIT